MMTLLIDTAFQSGGRDKKREANRFRGLPDTVEKLAARFLKHLGKDSLYELF